MLFDTASPVSYELRNTPHDHHQAIMLVLDREALLPRLAHPTCPLSNGSRENGASPWENF